MTTTKSAGIGRWQLQIQSDGRVVAYCPRQVFDAASMLRETPQQAAHGGEGVDILSADLTTAWCEHSRIAIVGTHWPTPDAALDAIRRHEQAWR